MHDDSSILSISRFFEIVLFLMHHDVRAVLAGHNPCMMSRSSPSQNPKVVRRSQPSKMMLADDDPPPAIIAHARDVEVQRQRQRQMQKRSQIRRLAAVAVMGTSALAMVVGSLGPSGIAGSSSQASSGSPFDLFRRKASASLPGGGCQITAALVPTEPIEPVWLSSYPGSGAKLGWNLVQALSGYVTGDEHMLNGAALDHVVSIKSHWPHPRGSPNVDDMIESVPRAVLLLRHPMNSIATFFTYLYEREHGDTLPPLEDWMVWRNAHAAEQVDIWARFVDYWLSRYRVDHRMIISYEGLTDYQGGVPTARALAKFLNEGQGVTTIDDESVPCVWAKVAMYKEVEWQNTWDDEEDESVGERMVLSEMESIDINEHSFYPYNEQLYQQMVDVMVALKEKFGDADARLSAHLDAYIRICQSHIARQAGTAIDLI